MLALLAPPLPSSILLDDVAVRGVGPQERDTCKCVLTALKGNESTKERRSTHTHTKNKRKLSTKLMSCVCNAMKNYGSALCQ